MYQMPAPSELRVDGLGVDELRADLASLGAWIASLADEIQSSIESQPTSPMAYVRNVFRKRIEFIRAVRCIYTAAIGIDYYGFVSDCEFTSSSTIKLSIGGADVSVCADYTNVWRVDYHVNASVPNDEFRSTVSVVETFKRVLQQTLSRITQPNIICDLRVMKAMVLRGTIDYYPMAKRDFSKEIMAADCAIRNAASELSGAVVSGAHTSNIVNRLIDAHRTRAYIDRDMTFVKRYEQQIARLNECDGPIHNATYRFPTRNIIVETRGEHRIAFVGDKLYVFVGDVIVGMHCMEYGILAWYRALKVQMTDDSTLVKNENMIRVSHMNIAHSDDASCEVVDGQHFYHIRGYIIYGKPFKSFFAGANVCCDGISVAHVNDQSGIILETPDMTIAYMRNRRTVREFLRFREYTKISADGVYRALIKELEYCDTDLYPILSDVARGKKPRVGHIHSWLIHYLCDKL